MTGPQYPPPPSAGSNAIGRFRIGIDQIGDIPPFDWWQTVISQYANSQVIIALISSFFENVDQTQNISAFYDKIWNVVTAEGYGLDVWGRIVGVNRVLNINTNSWFGFNEAAVLEAGQNITGFNQSPFYNGQPITSNYTLNDETYRALILAKAAFNITSGSIPSINRILMDLFPNRGNAFVTDGLASQPYFGFTESTTAFGFNQAPFYNGQALPRMVMQYVFKFALTPVELAIVTQSGVLPKPVGVEATVLILASSTPAGPAQPPPIGGDPGGGPAASTQLVDGIAVIQVF